MSTYFKNALTITTILALSACKMGPDYVRPTSAKPLAYKEASQETADWKQAKPQDQTIRGNWWAAFNDAELNILEPQVAEANQTVKAAEATFRQARALVAEARSGFFPTLTANVSQSRSATGAGTAARNGVSNTLVTTDAAGNTITTTSGSSGGSSSASIHNVYSAALDASWEPDFWGSVARTVESNKASAQASAADLQTALLTAQAELAIDYMDLRMADEQKRVLIKTVAAYTRTYNITENLYKAGVDARSDVMQAKVQLEQARAQMLDVGVARAQYEHAIAVLIGKAPAEFTLTEVNNVPIVPAIPATLPSELLERRPDIAAAERRVQAANAQIGVANAAFFPTITLSASGGYDSTGFAHWFTLPNRVWSIGPSLVETLFDAGLRAAQSEAAIASYDNAVANYRQTVLAGFQEVEDNLAGLRILAQEADAQNKAVVDSRITLDVILNQYKAGIVSYLNVITAQTTALNTQISAITIQRTRLADAVTLIKALGGGWHANALNAPDVTQGKATPFSLFPPSYCPSNASCAPGADVPKANTP